MERDLSQSPTDNGNAGAAAGSPATKRLILIGLGLVALTVALYFRVAYHQFVNFDDDVYVTDNPHVTTGLTAANVIWAFTSAHAANWHPVTWLSLMIDSQLFGTAPAGYHITNVALHAASAALLFYLLFRLTRGVWASAFVAALFAIHPLHVESVAWVAERKDVLSGFFLFVTLLFYTLYVERRSKLLYLATLVSFVVGLMAKPMLVSLPLLLLLLDWWPLNRDRSRSLVSEKIPFFVASFFSCIITMFAQSAGNAVNSVGFGFSLKNAAVSYVKYLLKTFWPHDLAVLYPLPKFIPAWQAASALLVLVAVTALVLGARKRAPFLAVGWFWFIITLVPVIGLVQVGTQAMADRYAYLPQIGLLIMVAWGWSALTAGAGNRAAVSGAVAAVVIAASAAVTWQQIGYWRDSIALFRHTLAVTSDNFTAHNDLGVALLQQGDLPAAEQEYRAALAVKPDYSDAHYNLGMALANQEKNDAALREFLAVLQLEPGYVKARNGVVVVHCNKGKALVERGDLAGAVAEYGEALAVNPNSAEAHDGMGVALGKKGDFAGAIREFRTALTIDPSSADADNNLRYALAQARN